MRRPACRRRLNRATPKSVLKPPLKFATVPASTTPPLGWMARPTVVRNTVRSGPKLTRRLAVRAEGGVQRAVGMVPRRAEITDAADRDRARHDDLAVGLDRDAEALENESGPKSVRTSPPEPNDRSSVPSLLYRTRAKSSTLLPSAKPLKVPTTTILPSGSIARAEATADPEGKGVKTVPPLPNPASRLPSLLYRATAKDDGVSTPRAVPATTILPSPCLWTAIPLAVSEVGPRIAGPVAMPPTPKPGWSEPGGSPAPPDSSDRPSSRSTNTFWLNRF